MVQSLRDDASGCAGRVIPEAFDISSEAGTVASEQAAQDWAPRVSLDFAPKGSQASERAAQEEAPQKPSVMDPEDKEFDINAVFAFLDAEQRRFDLA